MLCVSKEKKEELENELGERERSCDEEKGKW